MTRIAALFVAVLVLLLGGVAISSSPALDIQSGDWKRQRPTSEDLQKLFRDCRLRVPIDDLPVEKYRRVLGADEILYKRIRGSKSFELYIAKWAPENPYAHEAAKHPPDLCWSQTGWTMITGSNNVMFSSSLAPAHVRLFSIDMQMQNVAFWCVLAGKLIEIPVGPPPSRAARNGWRILTESEFLNRWRRGKPEVPQDPGLAIRLPATETPERESYFVRINSEHPLAEVMQTQDFNEVRPLLYLVGLKP